MAKIKLTKSAIDAAQPQAQSVEQARALAQTWLAEVRRGGDKAEARKIPTVKELCGRFMPDDSKQRNKPSTQKGYQGNINRNIIPILGRMKVQDVKRPDVAEMMKKLERTPMEANHTLAVTRKMFNMAEIWGLRTDGADPCRHIPQYPQGRQRGSLLTRKWASCSGIWSRWAWF